jgi:uncharacterized membrane protein HdeD (DUF308 family)
MQSLPDRATQDNWLKKYYLSRGAFAAAWVAIAVTVASRSPALAALLLVCYPAWDALANFVDGLRSGGLRANRSQMLNVVASGIVALAVAAALPDMHRVLGVFGTWAIASGLLQLATGLRRWKTSGAQWAMVLSGAQSAAAGAVFIVQSRAPAMPSIATVAGYAGFGAFYFLLSGVQLSVKMRRRAQ